MDWNDLETHFSSARLERYRTAQGGDTIGASIDYADNILLAEAMLPLLNVIEIALRNSVHARLSARYGRTDWWASWIGNPAFKRQNQDIVSARAKLIRHNEPQTADKIMAELTLGFWCSLFNAQMQTILWKDLRLVFARCPKSCRQRQVISSALNQIRNLRNRVFHHEPLLWLSPALLQQHALGMRVIRWIDPGLEQWLIRYDRLPLVWAARSNRHQNFQ